MLTNFRTTLSQKSQLNSDTYLFHFNLLEPKEINFKAGQYLILKVNDKPRLYSIASSAAKKNSFELIIQIIPGGLASNYLSNLKVKDEIVFQGPAGMFCLRKNKRPKIFLATGTGIAPILSMIKSQLSIINHQSSINLFWGLKTYEDVYLFDELKELVSAVIPAEAGIHLKICLSREENIDMITENDKKYFALGHVDSYSPLLTTADYYLCGGREIVESLRLFLINKGVLQENIYFEKF